MSYEKNGQKWKFTYPMARLMVFLHDHNREKFSFSELKNMSFFSSSSRLSNFLKFGVEKNLLKKTFVKTNKRKYAMYEIRLWANRFAEYLKVFL